MRAAILARVSTQGQKDNSSLDNQVARCTEFCIEHGYEIVETAREIFSGSFVLARSKFQNLLELGKQGKIERILVDIPDRLGRGDAIAQCELLARMNGCPIEYATSGHDTSTVEGLVQHSAAAMVSGIERLNIKRRMTDGKYNWAKTGRVIVTPLRMYGYRIKSIYDDQGHKLSANFIVVEDEAIIVRQIFSWVAHECLTSAEVARRLDAAGVLRISDIDDAHKAFRAVDGRQTLKNLARDLPDFHDWSSADNFPTPVPEDAHEPMSVLIDGRRVVGVRQGDQFPAVRDGELVALDFAKHAHFATPFLALQPQARQTVR